MQPLISICMPTLNARRFLEPRVDSIMSQTLTDWELIVCDSYSDDGTWEYLKQFDDDRRVKLYQVPRAGLYAGWNDCLRRAGGEYIYMATADDTMCSDCLEKLVSTLEREKKAKGKMYGNMNVPRPGWHGLPWNISMCNFDYIDENGEVIPPPLPPAGQFYGDERFQAHIRPGHVEFLVHLLIGTTWTTMTAVLFPRALLEKTGLFRTDCGALADRFWAYKSALFADTVVVPETLATWRQHSQQGSAEGKMMGELGRLRYLRKLYRGTVQTLEESAPMLPAKWKEDRNWRMKLLWAERRHYLDKYCLSRTSLRYQPLSFLTGFLCAAALEPHFLLRRTITGLSWGGDEGVSEDEYLRKLLKEFVWCQS